MFATQKVQMHAEGLQREKAHVEMSSVGFVETQRFKRGQQISCQRQRPQALPPWHVGLEMRPANLPVLQRADDLWDRRRSPSSPSSSWCATPPPLQALCPEPSITTRLHSDGHRPVDNGPTDTQERRDGVQFIHRQFPAPGYCSTIL